jgi:hypothetical protein
MPSGLTPFNWTENELITAAKLNALENRIVDGVNAAVTAADDAEVASVAASQAAEAAANAVLTGPVPLQGYTASHQFVLADGGKFLTMNSSSNTNFTLPADSVVNFPVGSVIGLGRLGSGTVTIAPASGVTLNSAANARTIAPRYATAALVKLSANNWILSGGLG